MTGCIQFFLKGMGLIVEQNRLGVEDKKIGYLFLGDCRVL
jgi:hypothetical protein